MRLQLLVSHAYRTVPYYRGLMKQAGIKPADLRAIGDLRHLPVTTKRDLRDAGHDACISSKYRSRRLHLQSTSGSSGMPFKVYREVDAELRRTGFFLRALASAGYRVGNGLLMVVEPPDRQPPAWTRWRKLSFAEPAERLVEEMNRHRPKIVFGYVSPLRQLAILVSQGVSIHRPQAVVTVSEALDDTTRRQLEDTLKTKVFEIYGNVECGVIAWECPTHDGLHVAEDLVIVEQLPGADENSWRVVVTNLNVFAMPFLRYDTGDLAVNPPSGSCPCGRRLGRIGRLSGREMDGIDHVDGSFVPPFSITDFLDNISSISRFQVVQDRIGQIRVRLEQTEPPDEETANRIRNGMRSIIGAETKVTIEALPTLEPPPGNKFRIVENRSPRR